MDTLKIGDRVVITITPGAKAKPLRRYGVIVGEGHTGASWIIRRDDIKSLFGYHKSFCRPESPDDAAA